MNDMQGFHIYNTVPSELLVAGDEERIHFRHHFTCEAMQQQIANRCRVIVYPTLLVHDDHDDVTDGLKISISAMTVPAESA